MDVVALISILAFICMTHRFVAALDLNNQGEMNDAMSNILGDRKKNADYFYGPPTYTQEEEGEWLMPKPLKCDGCLAIAYQLEKQFELEEKLRSKKGMSLTESQIIDVCDKVCTKGFKNFGLKLYKGRNRLSGEGMMAFYEPGISSAGEGWMERVRGQCKEIIGHFEEETIYWLYKNSKGKSLGQVLCKSYCSKEDMKQYTIDLPLIHERQKIDEQNGVKSEL